MNEKLFYRSSAFRLRTLGLVASSWMMIGCGDTLETESEWTSENSQNAIEMEGNSLAEDAEDIPVINIEDMKWEEEVRAERDREFEKAGWERKDREVKHTRVDQREFKKLKKESDRQEREVAIDQRDPTDGDRQKVAAKVQIKKGSGPFEETIGKRAAVYKKWVDNSLPFAWAEVFILDWNPHLEHGQVDCSSGHVYCGDGSIIILVDIKPWHQVQRDRKTIKVSSVEFKDDKELPTPVYKFKKNKIYLIQNKTENSKPLKFNVTLSNGKTAELELPVQ